MDKVKILFAIGNQEAEDYIESELKKDTEKEYEVVGAAVYKESIVDLIVSKGPDVIVIREGLEGSKDTDLFLLAKSITREFPSIRVIFLSALREIGDPKLAELVGYHIYDIITGSTVNIGNIIDRIKNPQTFAQASKYLPKNGNLINKEDFSGLEGKDEKEDDKKNEEIISEEIIEDNKEKEIPKEEKENKSEENKNDIEKENSLLKKISQTRVKEFLLKKNKNKKNNENNKNEEVDITKLSKEDILAIKKEILEELRLEQLENEKKKKKANKTENKNIGQKKEDKKTDNRKNGLDKIKIPKPATDIFTSKTNSQVFFGKDKIVTFWGAKSGIGTTLVAYNVAMDLALRQHKVLFIEFNEKNPMIPYWFDVYGNLPLDIGIDKAVLGYETRNYRDINNSIITRKELMDKVNYTAFKQFPPQLDYLFFSPEYLERKDKPILSQNSISQVLLYCMKNLNYNYIILDMNTNSNVSLIENALTFSNKNYLVVSQEFSSIGYCQLFFDDLSRRGLDFNKQYDGKRDASDKNSYIVNRFNEKAQFDLRTIVDWVNSKKVFTVCDNLLDVYNLSFMSLPIMLKSTNKTFKQNISEISTDIERV